MVRIPDEEEAEVLSGLGPADHPFEIVRKLNGKAGNVYILRRIDGKLWKAVKTIRLDDISKDSIEHELQICAMLAIHPAIVCPSEVLRISGGLAYTMRCFDASLEDLIRSRGPLSERDALVITSQILRALYWARKSGLDAHQDLKPANILLELTGRPTATNEEGRQFRDYTPNPSAEILSYRVVIADFGMANAYQKSGLAHGYRPYMAPEQYAPERFSKFEPDAFAVGVILSELLRGLHPSGLSHDDLDNWNYKKWEKWAEHTASAADLAPPDTSRKTLDIIRGLLAPNPADRLTVEAADKAVLDALKSVDARVHDDLIRYVHDEADKFVEEEGIESQIFALSKLTDPQLIPFATRELSRIIIANRREDHDRRSARNQIDALDYLARILIKRGNDGDKKRAGDIAHEILTIATKYNTAQRGTTKPDDHPHHSELSKTFAESGLNLERELGGLDRESQAASKHGPWVQAVHQFRLARPYRHTRTPAATIKMAMHFDEAIRLAPHEPDFHYWQARWIPGILALGGEHFSDTFAAELCERAIESARRAAELDPSWPEYPAVARNTETWSQTYLVERAGQPPK